MKSSVVAKTKKYTSVNCADIDSNYDKNFENYLKFATFEWYDYYKSPT